MLAREERGRLNIALMQPMASFFGCSKFSFLFNDDHVTLYDRWCLQSERAWGFRGSLIQASSLNGKPRAPSTRQLNTAHNLQHHWILLNPSPRPSTRPEGWLQGSGLGVWLHHFLLQFSVLSGSVSALVALADLCAWSTSGPTCRGEVHLPSWRRGAEGELMRDLAEALWEAFGVRASSGTSGLGQLALASHKSEEVLLSGQALSLPVNTQRSCCFFGVCGWLWSCPATRLCSQARLPRTHTAPDRPCQGPGI